ncbi:MAG: hypothetical protein UZ21_OP11001000885, partial [Microgenomates bacterium OLB22]
NIKTKIKAKKGTGSDTIFEFFVGL